MFNYISIMSNNSILKEKFNNKSLDDNYIKNLISLYASFQITNLQKMLLLTLLKYQIEELIG